jgi:hypothetical protein
METVKESQLRVSHQVETTPRASDALQTPSACGREDYDAMRQLIIEDIQPRSNIEWLWLLDLAELSWEILRYRKLKVRAFAMYRVKAIETLLLQIDGASLTENNPTLRQQARINAVEWQADPLATREIETRLTNQGFDLETINAAVLIQAQAAYTLFDNLAQGAQARRTTFVRETTFVGRSK